MTNLCSQSFYRVELLTTVRSPVIANLGATQAVNNCGLHLSEFIFQHKSNFRKSILLPLAMSSSISLVE